MYYYPDESPVANLLDISSNDCKEHFLLPLIVSALYYLSKVEAEHGFVKTSSIYEKIQSLGFLPEQIDLAIIRGYQKRLIEAAAGRIPQPGLKLPQTLRLTSVGAYHVLRLISNFPYLDAVIVDTPILNQHFRDTIHQENSIEKRLDRANMFRQYLDDCWNPLNELGAATFLDWLSISKDLKEELELVKKRILG